MPTPTVGSLRPTAPGIAPPLVELTMIGPDWALDKDAPAFRPIQRTESSTHTRSLADCITITSGFRFSVHTRAPPRPSCQLIALPPIERAGLDFPRISIPGERAHPVRSRLVMALRTDGNQRYSMTKNKRSPFVSWTRTAHPLLQHNHLM